MVTHPCSLMKIVTFFFHFEDVPEDYALDDTHKNPDVENQQKDRPNHLTRIYNNLWKVAVQHCKKSICYLNTEFFLSFNS